MPRKLFRVEVAEELTDSLAGVDSVGGDSPQIPSLASRMAVVLLGVLTLTVATIGLPTTAAGVREAVEVKVLGAVTLLDGGAAVEVRVLVQCDPTPPLLEAGVTGSQEGNVGFGQGFFRSVTCDGRPHVEAARIETFDDERFQRGKAFVSAFVLLCDETGGDCFSGGDARLVQLH